MTLLAPGCETGAVASTALGIFEAPSSPALPAHCCSPAALTDVSATQLPPRPSVVEAGVAMIPALSRAKALRSWGGVMDMSMDGSPIIDKTPIEGLYLNAGWCYGGFKATPGSGWCFSHLIADKPTHHIAQMRLDRFKTGRVIDELGAGAQHNLH